MADKYTVYKPNLMEGGAYFQVLTVGMYFSYNEISGVNVGFVHQVSAGIAAYNSGGISYGFQSGFKRRPFLPHRAVSAVRSAKRSAI